MLPTLKHQTPEQCPFCQRHNRPILWENEAVFAILDLYPISKGHTLIIPTRHTASYFDLDANEQKACWQAVNIVKELLQEMYEPQGFNIGINVGSTAGQTIGHVHIHLIPRYDGDVADPAGGIRHLMPGKGHYTPM